MHREQLQERRPEVLGRAEEPHRAHQEGRERPLFLRLSFLSLSMGRLQLRLLDSEKALRLMAEGFFWMPYGRNLRKSISKSLEKLF